MGTHTPINIPNKQGQLTLLGNLCYLLVSVIFQSYLQNADASVSMTKSNRT